MVAEASVEEGPRGGSDSRGRGDDRLGEVCRVAGDVEGDTVAPDDPLHLAVVLVGLDDAVGQAGLDEAPRGIVLRDGGLGLSRPEDVAPLEEPPVEVVREDRVAAARRTVGADFLSREGGADTEGEEENRDPERDT